MAPRRNLRQRAGAAHLGRPPPRCAQRDTAAHDPPRPRWTHAVNGFVAPSAERRTPNGAEFGGTPPGKWFGGTFDGWIRQMPTDGIVLLMPFKGWPDAALAFYE